MLTAVADHADNFVEPHTVAVAAPPPRVADPPRKPPPPSAKKMCKVTFDYEGQNEDELSLKVASQLLPQAARVWVHISSFCSEHAADLVLCPHNLVCILAPLSWAARRDH